MTGREAAEKALALAMANAADEYPGTISALGSGRFAAQWMAAARIACDAIEKAIIAYAAEPGRGVPWDAIAGEEGGEK